MIILLSVVLYFLIAFSFILFDAFVGFQMKYGKGFVPLIFAASLWFLFIPVEIFLFVENKLQIVKSKRLAKENKIRIDIENQEKEIEKIFLELDKEERKNIKSYKNKKNV